jgi:hypothetical protein
VARWQAVSSSGAVVATRKRAGFETRIDLPAGSATTGLTVRALDARGDLLATVKAL